MIKAVLFDFGGVLSESGKAGFVRSILAELYGISLDDLYSDKLQQAWRRDQVDEKEVLDDLNRHFGKKITPEMFYAKAHGAILRSPEVYGLAEQLRQLGIKTGILSNIFSTTAGELRSHGFYDGFDPVVLSCEQGYAKPDEELYKIAIQKAGVKAGEILFIDDQEKCRPPAEKLGMHFLLATSSQQIVEDTLKIINQQNDNTFGEVS
jgi:epoxide hydrolase-like predicted phosphatase